VTYKITIEIKANKLTPDQLKQTSRQLSDAVKKMGFDHALICHLNAIRKFRIAKNNQDVSKRIKQVLEDPKFP
jgi:hypothetical protein